MMSSVATPPEGSQRELRARLADGLRRDDSHGRADVGAVSRSQVTSVTHRADAVLGLTGEHRANLHLGDSRVHQRLGLLFVDLLIAGDDRRRRTFGIETDLLGRPPSDNPVDERFDDLFADADVADRDTVGRAAIFLADDDVLRDVD
jgi:hypothetical protein